MAGAAAASIPSVAALDVVDGASFRSAIALLFEGAAGFAHRLEEGRPYGTPETLFRTAERIALELDDHEAVELLDAHPRLGAPPGSVSALSFVEQGYEREAADKAAEDERRRVDAELARLNDAYEQTFGFRYCVFVGGRSRAALLPDFRNALAASREDEMRRGLIDVVRIGRDRYLKLRAGEPG
jgi:2-oxo-4-hydroxy-4-carboxy--5-ureidoimidazoline (OHCU) decarboxylase